MQFRSFQQAVEVLVSSDEDIQLYEETLAFCIESLPPEVVERLYFLYRDRFYEAEPTLH